MAQVDHAIRVVLYSEVLVAPHSIHLAGRALTSGHPLVAQPFFVSRILSVKEDKP